MNVSSSSDKHAQVELPFEDALKKLEEIVLSMESGNASLEETIKRFDEGKKLSDLCSKKLLELERKIEVLVKENDDGGKWKETDSPEQE